jgi:hypothetical protein
MARRSRPRSSTHGQRRRPWSGPILYLTVAAQPCGHQQLSGSAAAHNGHLPRGVRTRPPARPPTVRTRPPAQPIISPAGTEAEDDRGPGLPLVSGAAAGLPGSTRQDGVALAPSWLGHVALRQVCVRACVRVVRGGAEMHLGCGVGAQIGSISSRPPARSSGRNSCRPRRRTPKHNCRCACCLPLSPHDHHTTHPTPTIATAARPGTHPRHRRAARPVRCAADAVATATGRSSKQHRQHQQQRQRPVACGSTRHAPPVRGHSRQCSAQLVGSSSPGSHPPLGACVWRPRARPRHAHCARRLPGGALRAFAPPGRRHAPRSSRGGRNAGSHQADAVPPLGGAGAVAGVPLWHLQHDAAPAVNLPSPLARRPPRPVGRARAHRARSSQEASTSWLIANRWVSVASAWAGCLGQHARVGRLCLFCTQRQLHTAHARHACCCCCG